MSSGRPVVDLAPINTGMYAGGEPTDQGIEFFHLRSGRGITACFIGNVGVIPELTPHDSTGLIRDTRSWRKLCEAIKSAGSSPGVQLNCTPPRYLPRRQLERNPLQDEELERYRTLLRAIPETMWRQVEKAFLSSIVLSQELGFEHVQIHAAHGYLFSLVLDPVINDTRRGLEVLENILHAVACARSIRGSLRVSWRAGLANDELRAKIIEDFWRPFRGEIRLDISAGYYNIDKSLIYPSREAGQAPLLAEAVALAERHRDSKISVAGNIWNPFAMPPLPDNLSFAIGRNLIADPDHLKRMADGRAMVCDHCDNCHYFSRNLPSLVCPKWGKTAESQTFSQHR